VSRLSELEAQLENALSRPVRDEMRVLRLTLAISQEKWLNDFGPTDRDR